MKYNIGDMVTRNSHQNDIIFTIIDIKGDTYYLKGLNTRLLADAPYNAPSISHTNCFLPTWAFGLY